MSEQGEEHMCNLMECSACGFEWVAVHPVCERVQCVCGHWNQVPPVEQDPKKTTLSGREPRRLTPGAPDDINPETGQHKDHWILSDDERAKGFVRPYNESYVHATCGTTTAMPRKIAETYAVNSKFYSTTFCCGCRGYFPVGEFVWAGTNNIVGE